jgi:hypothetical protein
VQQFFIGEINDVHACSGNMRVVVEEVEDGGEGDLQSILLASGADAAVFPERFATAGMESGHPNLQLRYAQGHQIPVLCMRDLKIHLSDELGRKIVLQEHVAISAHVQQPILCFGKLMESGWVVDACEQSLVHNTGVKVPIELQNRSMVVKGFVRAICRR